MNKKLQETSDLAGTFDRVPAGTFWSLFYRLNQCFFVDRQIDRVGSGFFSREYFECNKNYASSPFARPIKSKLHYGTSICCGFVVQQIHNKSK